MIKIACHGLTCSVLCFQIYFSVLFWNGLFILCFNGFCSVCLSCSWLFWNSFLSVGTCVCLFLVSVCSLLFLLSVGAFTLPYFLGLLRQYASSLRCIIWSASVPGMLIVTELERCLCEKPQEWHYKSVFFVLIVIWQNIQLRDYAAIFRSVWMSEWGVMADILFAFIVGSLCESGLCLVLIPVCLIILCVLPVVNYPACLPMCVGVCLCHYISHCQFFLSIWTNLLN